MDGGLRVIADGLQQTDRVIVTGLLQARPGTTVQPKPVNLPAGAAGGGNSQVSTEGWRINSCSHAFSSTVLSGLGDLDRDRAYGRDRGGPAPDRGVPADHPPTVEVTATYPGASARVVADTVAAPIEQQVVGVEDMLYMTSYNNNDGSYTLDVTSRLAPDVNMAQVLVQNRVAVALPTLPDVVKNVGVTVKKRSPDILPGGEPLLRRGPEDPSADVRPALQEQFRHDPAQGRVGAGGGCRRRDDLRHAGLQHARLAGPRGNSSRAT